MKGKLLFIGSVLLLVGVGLVGCGGGGGEGGSQARLSGGPASTETALDTQGLVATVFLSPTCGCCHGYVEHLRQHGVRVETVEMMDVAPKKRALGIPMEMWSCHTVVIGDYVVEGHVPFEVVQKLLTDKPDIDGIALPGMPTGVPGMPGEKTPLTVYAFQDGKVWELMTF